MARVRLQWLKFAIQEYSAPLRDFSDMVTIWWYLLWTCGLGVAVFLPMPWPIRTLIVSALWIVLGISAVYRVLASKNNARRDVARILAELSLYGGSVEAAHEGVEIHEAHIADLEKLRLDWAEVLPDERKAIDIWVDGQLAKWEQGRPAPPDEDSTTVLSFMRDTVELVLGRTALPIVFSAVGGRSEVERLHSYVGTINRLTDEVREGKWDDEFTKEAIGVRQDALRHFIERLDGRTKRVTKSEQPVGFGDS